MHFIHKMPSYKFIVNPIPLRNKHRIFLKELGEKLARDKINFSLECTTKNRNAAGIAKEASKKYDVVVACGGDGTIMEVVNGIYGSEAVLGVLPLGTSNDFAKHVDINIKNCVEILIRNKPRKIDLGVVEFNDVKKSKKLLFCSTSGIGFDARLLKLNNYKMFIRLKRIIGNIIYPLCAFFLMHSYKSSEVDLKLNGKTIKTRLFMLNANFVRSMSGIKATPNADVDNGLFDVIIFEDGNMLKKIVGFLWYSVTCRKLPFREIDYISNNSKINNKYNLKNITSFSIKSEKPLELQLNGDFVGYTPAKFKVLPKSLQFIA